MLTEKDYCDKDTCVALEELGYKENPFFPHILLYEAHKFLREEKGLHIEIDRVGYDWLVSVIETKNNLCLAVKNRCQSYEEALLEGIKAAVKKLKEEKYEDVDSA